MSNEAAGFIGMGIAVGLTVAGAAIMLGLLEIAREMRRILGPPSVTISTGTLP